LGCAAPKGKHRSIWLCKPLQRGSNV